MNEQVKDGGPAFPLPTCNECGTAHQAHLPSDNGMTLRDYFAGQALSGICAGWSQSQHPDARAAWAPTEQVGYWAYRAADAMLKARESK